MALHDTTRLVPPLCTWSLGECVCVLLVMAVVPFLLRWCSGVPPSRAAHAAHYMVQVHFALYPHPSAKRDLLVLLHALLHARVQLMANLGYNWQLNEAALHAAKAGDITSSQVCDLLVTYLYP